MCDVISYGSVNTRWGIAINTNGNILKKLAEKPQKIPDFIADRFFRMDDLFNAIQFGLNMDVSDKNLKNMTFDEAEYLTIKAIKSGSASYYEPKFSQDELKDRLKNYQAFMKDLDARRETTQDDVPMLKECSTFLRNLEHALYNA
ncbi:hypothetical protein J4219_02345 [Candidatus Woesearchaeota archaeon]|nr:hypothetical protein [Candidatus Woesearchaeota archaeon]